MIRVKLPTHLRMLAKVDAIVELHIEEPITRQAILDTLEQTYPMLRGTIRDIATGERRAFIRFYACGEDLSNEPADAPVPSEVVAGKQPFRIVGAMAGG